MINIKNSIAVKSLIFFILINLVFFIEGEARSRDQLIELTGNESAEGIIVGFFGPDRFIKSEKISPWISVVHSCFTNDDLILEKVEIYGETQEPIIATFINKSLKAMGKEVKQFRELMNEAELKRKEIDKLAYSKLSERSEYEEKEIATLIEKYRKFIIETQPLYEGIYSEFYFPIDLKELKDPKKGCLVAGDRIPITAKIFFIHKNKSVIVTKTIVSECIPDPFAK